MSLTHTQMHARVTICLPYMFYPAAVFLFIYFLFIYLYFLRQSWKKLGAEAAESRSLQMFLRAAAAAAASLSAALSAFYLHAKKKSFGGQTAWKKKKEKNLL